MDTRASRSWRPFGFWALTINSAVGFPVILIGLVVMPDSDWAVAAGAYATVLATWAAAAGIRQWGKNSNTY